MEPTEDIAAVRADREMLLGVLRSSRVAFEECAKIFAACGLPGLAQVTETHARNCRVAVALIEAKL